VVFTRYYDQSVVAPAKTPITAPVSIPVALETNHLERIEIDVPDGHDRQTGIQFVSNGTVIVPFSANGFIVANNHYFEIPFNDDITTGDIVIQAYNTDIFDHTFYVRFVMSNSQLAAAANIVSSQNPGTVAPGADQGVAALAVTPDDLAATPPVTPPSPDLSPAVVPGLPVTP
jgi:hypothetical protein